MRSLCVLILAPLLLAPLADAATLKVPGMFATIDAAVDAAWPGDVVEISKGVYHENVDVIGRLDVTIRARKNDRVVIDAGGSSYGIRVKGSNGIVIKRLRIRNADVSAGIVVDGATDVLLEDCRVRKCVEEGIHVIAADNVMIQNCTIEEVGGDGIILDGTQCVVEGCTLRDVGHTAVRVMRVLNTIVDNLIERPEMTGVALGSGSLTCRDCLVMDNKIVEAGADGVNCRNQSESCTVVGNVIRKPNLGIFVDPGSPMHIVSSNVVQGAEDTAITIRGDDNVVSDNKVKKSGEAGIYLRGPGHHNLLLGNKATKCGTYGFHLITSGNTLVQNKGWKNSEFDLYDINPVGSNAYLDNSFEKIGP